MILDLEMSSKTVLAVLAFGVGRCGADRLFVWSKTLESCTNNKYEGSLSTSTSKDTLEKCSLFNDFLCYYTKSFCGSHSTLDHRTMLRPHFSFG